MSGAILKNKMTNVFTNIELIKTVKWLYSY